MFYQVSSVVVSKLLVIVDPKIHKQGTAKDIH